MALIVQKYGGTSVGNPERIKNVAQRVAKFKMLGHQVVVVLSAMSGETNRLIALAKEIQPNPDLREMDVLVSTGEQVTIALLSMALMELGLKAKSYTGSQVKIVTDSAADLPAEQVQAHGIRVVPLTIRFGDDEYVDGVDLTPEAFYEKMASLDVLPATAAGEHRAAQSPPSAAKHFCGAK